MRRTAALLKRPPRARKGLPRLLVFSDPARTPDVEALARAMPLGAALVYRSFGAGEAEATARRLLPIVRARRGKLLIGADWRLAAAVGADGVHLPERLAFRAAALKRRHPDWIVTAAAHSPRAARSGRGADALVVSTAFPSASPSAGRPMGPLRLALLVRRAGAPVFALGGVNARTAARLKDTGVVGLAAVAGART